jgi:methylmalonyl-CoA mutase
MYSLKNKRPAAFMFTYGNLAMRIARSQFSRNFFACAGYETIDNYGFKTIEDGVKAALESKAEIVVVCSADDDYPIIAPAIYEGLRNKALVVVAGYPKDSIEELRAKGIEHFIHVRANVLETLTAYQQMLGII